MAARAPGSYGQTPRQQAATTARKIDISGTYNDPAEVAEVLENAAQHFNIIGSIAFGDLPEGFSVVLSTLKIDVTSETYDVGFQKRGLGSAAVRRIAGAAGVSTISSINRGWAVNYAAWEVTVARLELDGTVRRETGNRVMDLRDGGSQAEAMRDKIIAQNNRERDPTKHRDPEGQLREQRLHIGAHAETKAWLRAVRTLLGLRTYTGQELLKPFAIAKLQFTGRTNDPALKMMFAQGLMQTALGGMAQLYGPQPAAAYQLGAGAPPPPQLSMGGGFPPGDDFDDEPPPPPARQHRAAAPPPPSDRGPQAEPPSDRRPSQSASGQAIDPTRFAFRFGREKDVPIVNIQDLEFYERFLVKNIADPTKEQYRARDEAVLVAVRAELRRRSGEVDEDPPPDDEDEREPGDDG